MSKTSQASGGGNGTMGHSEGFNPGASNLTSMLPIRNTGFVETNTHYVLSVELPGVDPSDLDVKFNERDLVIKALRSEEVEVDELGLGIGIGIGLGSNNEKVETLKTKISRTIQLPYNINLGNYESSFKNSIFTIKFPKFKVGKKIHINI